MSSIKFLVSSISAALAAASCVVASAQSPAPTLQLSVDGRNHLIASGVSGAEGIRYEAAGTAGILSVATDGYVFCSNIGALPATGMNLRHAENAPAGTAPMLWAQPQASISHLTYTSTGLTIDSTAPVSSLTCVGVARDGSTHGLRDWIFDNGYDLPMLGDNYPHWVNWHDANAPEWNDPEWELGGDNWDLVPAAACGPDAYAGARVKEDNGCAAVTGVQRKDVGGTLTDVRSPKMLAQVRPVGLSFMYTYLFRVDVQSGVPAAPPALAVPPAATSGDDASVSANSMKVRVRDAYNSYFLEGTGASYCLLTQLPSSATADVCADALPGNKGTLTGDGFFNWEFTAGFPFDSTSFYVAITRKIKNDPLSYPHYPLAAATIFVDPAQTAEGYDRFIGDNTVFSFITDTADTSVMPPHGFPWMLAY